MRRKYSLLLITVFIFATACSKKGNDDNKKKSSIDIPEISEECRTGKCVEGQWETSFRRFAIVTADMLNVRKKATKASGIAARFPNTRKVTVLYIKPDIETIGDMTGSWAFVRDTENLKSEGWIFGPYIGFKHNFIKMQRWGIRIIKVRLGSKEDIFTCTRDGRFVNRQIRQGKEDVIVKGEIMRYRSVVWFKKEKPDDYPVFFRLRIDGSLALQDQYKKGYIEVVK